MALILNIDTALENGSVGLLENDVLIARQSSADQKEHATFLQPAVRQIMLDAGKKMTDIHAVAVAIGPGSYTGLRVGLASAKGLCYALQKPLITINTLDIIALATKEAAIETYASMQNLLFCTMIDARRMEVFTATFDFLLDTIDAPVAMVLDENSFFDKLEENKVVFSGNGVAKFKNICRHPNAFFVDTKHKIDHLAKLAAKAYEKGSFADLPYSVPFYAKAFHSTQLIKN